MYIRVIMSLSSFRFGGGLVPSPSFFLDLEGTEVWFRFRDGLRLGGTQTKIFISPKLEACVAGTRKGKGRGIHA